ncbi:MAG: nucleotidyltransferase family protein [Methanomicrobiales archaeon]|nr:nucleotidyltransferase family protein [Methanomicrobiales archaeon]
MPGQLAPQRRKNIVIKKLEAKAPAIRTQFGVTKIGIFGSFARNEQTRKSDVDVLVDFAPGNATLHNFVSLCDYLEALFRRKVDLLTEPSISNLLRPYIEQDVIWIEG